MRFALLCETHCFSYIIVTNVFVLETKRIESTRSNFRPTHATHVANSNFEAELISKLLPTGTHLRKRAVATLSYSPESTLHPQAISALAFFAGLHKVDRENDKRASPSNPSSPWYMRSVSEGWHECTCHTYKIIAWAMTRSIRMRTWRE